MKRFTGALALALMFPASAGAADVARLMSPISGMNGIEVSGTIGADDWKKFEELANKMSDYDHTLVVLRSPGGNAVGVEMGDFIHKTGMSTLVPDNETCASVCAFIWLGGARRFLYPKSHIGFHGVYNAAGEVDHDAGISDAIVGVYLGHLGFGYGAASWMLSPPVRSMHWLSEAEAKKFGIHYESLASTASSAPAPTPTPAPTPASAVQTKFRVTFNLNLRDGPGSAHANILSRWAPEDYISPGIVFTWNGLTRPEVFERFCRISDDGDMTRWCRISFDHHGTSTTGWAAAKYLEEMR